MSFDAGNNHWKPTSFFGLKFFIKNNKNYFDCQKKAKAAKKMFAN